MTGTLRGFFAERERLATFEEVALAAFFFFVSAGAFGTGDFFVAGFFAAVLDAFAGVLEATVAVLGVFFVAIVLFLQSKF